LLKTRRPIHGSGGSVPLFWLDLRQANLRELRLPSAQTFDDHLRSGCMSTGTLRDFFVDLLARMPWVIAGRP
jgi:hypothetical protein